MLRNIPVKVGIALLTFLALLDLQLYVNRFHNSGDMLGRYLRRFIDHKPLVRAEPAASADAERDMGLVHR